MNTKIKTRRFIARHLNFLVELVYKIRFKVLVFKSEPILILTPGKVGSSSIYYTLKRYTKHPVFHIHRFSQNGIEESRKENLLSDRKSVPLHLIVSKNLRTKLKDYPGRVYIIVSVREPISREVSSFFQNTEMLKNTLEGKNLNIDREKAIDVLSKKLKSNICHSLAKWFEEEIYANFGINVFETPFDEKQGYTIVRNEKYHFLLLKMEDVDRIFQKAITEFLNLDNQIILEHENIGDSKHYADAYNEIKNKIKLSQDDMDSVVHSKFFELFYKSQEVGVRDKWQEKQH